LRGTSESRIEPSFGTADSSALVYCACGAAKMRVCRAFLDLLASVHHDDAIGNLRDHAHVMRDEHHGHVHFVLQQADQREDLRLDRDVERGGRLVRNQQRRTAGEGHRDHHPLTHSAGKLMRITRQHSPRFGNAHLLEHRQRLGARARRVLALVQAYRLGDLLADGEHRVERRHRLLEDHRDLGAADVAQRRGRRLREIDPAAVGAIEIHAPADDPAARHARRGA
jgi:hypothetical protein